MDSCLLCLERNNDIWDFIEVDSSQWNSLNITNILEKHFWSLKTLQSSSWICLSCWQKVDDFNNFYLRVKEAHMIFESIKIEEETYFLESEEDPIANEVKGRVTTRLEVEILTDPNIYNVLTDKASYSQNSNKTIIVNDETLEDSNCINFRNRPVTIRKISTEIEGNKPDKPVSIRTISTETELLSKDTDDLGINSQLENYSDNDFSNNSTDDEEDDPLKENNCINFGNRPVTIRKISTETKLLNQDTDDLQVESQLKYSIRKISTETEVINQEIDDLQKKSQLEDYSDNDNSNISTDNGNGVDNNHLYKNDSEYKQFIDNLTNKEKDEFIAKHLKEILCDLCETPLENFCDAMQHFQKVHNQKGYIRCCNRKYFNRGLLVDHLRCHLNPNYFKCSQCDKVLSDRYHLKLHMQRVHRPDDVVYKHRCDICGKSYPHFFLLSRHKRSHPSSEELKKYLCTECGKYYKNPQLLKSHINTVHLKKYIRICDICGKQCNTSSEYKTHRRIHDVNSAVNCDECGLRLVNAISLKRHKRVQHPVGGKQDHHCTFCNKISPTAKALRQHILIIHKKGYDHNCSVCDKSFKRLGSLREHMATHTGDTLYKCKWCQKGYNSHSNMTVHFRKCHPKEWEEEKFKRYYALNSNSCNQ